MRIIEVYHRIILSDLRICRLLKFCQIFNGRILCIVLEIIDRSIRVDFALFLAVKLSIYIIERRDDSTCENLSQIYLNLCLFQGPSYPLLPLLYRNGIKLDLKDLRYQQMKVAHYNDLEWDWLRL